MDAVGAIAIPLLAAHIFMPGLFQLLVKGGAVRPNYRGCEVIQGGGLIFVLVYLVFTLWYLFIIGPDMIVILMLVAIMGMSLVGFLDDIITESGPRGFRGHFGCLWWRKELTSGFLKAFFGVIIALVATLAQDTSLLRTGVNTLLIVLSANTFNLLDCRPGRANKVFLIYAAFLIAFSRGEKILLLLPLLITLLLFLPRELSEEIMLGDTGANSLGAALGFYGALTLDISVNLTLVIVFLLFHFFCEKFSVSSLIERSRVLSFIDLLGRRI